MFGHRGKPLLEIELSVGASDPRLVELPIAALLARESFQRDTFRGFIDHAPAQQRIVDTQRTFLVGTKNKS